MSQPKALYVSPGHTGVYLDPQTWLVGDTPRLHLKNAAQWVAHCVATASTTFTPQGSMDGETWIALESAITPSAGTVHRGDCSGFQYVRFAIGGGTGILGFALTDDAVAEVTATLSGGISPSVSTLTTTTPSVATATSVTAVAANASRKYLLVQNNTAANIMLSLSGAALTDIVPSATNIGIVIAAGGSYESTGTACPVSAITVYQTSGGTVRTIVCVEG